MRNKNLIPVILIFFSVLLCSCYNFNCAPAAGLRISTIGFSPSEINKIILKKYNKGSGFTALVDTLLIDTSNANFTVSTDTLNMTSFRSTVLLQSSYDYQISFPIINKSVNITGIEEPQQKEKHSLFSGKNGCVNSITSYQINNMVVSISGNDDRLFVRR